MQQTNFESYLYESFKEIVEIARKEVSKTEQKTKQTNNVGYTYSEETFSPETHLRINNYMYGLIGDSNSLNIRIDNVGTSYYEVPGIIITHSLLGGSGAYSTNHKTTLYLVSKEVKEYIKDYREGIEGDLQRKIDLRDYCTSTNKIVKMIKEFAR